jgi:CheY-like chemotaxis protein/GGDEF domain-containing protein
VPSPTTERARLLCVDDDKIILDLLRRTFSREYDVHAAASGPEALQYLREHPIDLILTDQKMPGMTGLELIAEARKQTPDVAAILLTAYTDPEDLIAAINEGRVYRYVTKPWNTADLVITVKNALDTVRLRRERDSLLRRLERRLEAMSVLVDISAQASAPQSHAHLLELVTRALPKIVSFDVAASLVVPPGPGGPGPASMHLHCPPGPDGGGVVDEATLLSARDKALEIYNHLVASPGAEGLSVDQDELLVNVSGARVRSTGERSSALAAQPRSEIRSSLHLPIVAPGAQGGVVGLLYVASLRAGAFNEDDDANLEVLATQTAELLRRLSVRILDERRKMELMVESMADGVIMTDATGEVFLINPMARKMLGLDETTPVTAKFLKERLGFYPFDLVRASNTKEPLREELKLGDQFLHSIVSPVLDHAGAPVGVVVVLRDITERKALDTRKEEFVSIVSHELRTPLTSITGALDLVLDQYGQGLTDKQQRYIELARDSCGRLNSIVDDLLDVAKVERGKLTMRMGSVDLTGLARDAVERFRAAGEQKSIQLGVRATDEVRILGDADRLTQVVNNLVSNAIKFTPDGGKIEVDIFGPEVSRSFVGLSIWNNGVSIDEEHRERVFDKFEQIQSSNTRKVGGTGLGLAISRGIVEGHGGRIWVEGVPTDKEGGTRFVLTLPLTPPENTEVPIEKEDAAATPSVAQKSILVVDDDRFTTYIVKGMLIAAGYKVYLAHDSDTALSIAREKRPDLVTVDLRMPGVDGLALVEILKHDPETRKTPVVVLSISDDRERAQAVGADAYLSKPVDMGPLAETIAKLLAERGQRRQKILLVDDDPGIRMICRDVLEAHGYLAREAPDGEKALVEARRFKPDLVLVDVMMPDMDGFQLAQKLRGDREMSLTPIIFLSARGQVADKVRAFKLGAEDYLVKPFDAAELVARVERALMRRDLELGASPTTRLPGSQAIEAEIDRRLASGGDFAFCYLDLDNLKAFNDYYGYAKADGVILQTGDIVREVVARVGGQGDFIGHIAGDDFVFITTAELADRVCSTVIETFDRLVPLYYNKADRERGFIETNDRYGVLRRFPTMSVSIACVTRRSGFHTHAELSKVAAQGKQVAKAIPGSSYVRDGALLLPRDKAQAASS